MAARKAKTSGESDSLYFLKVLLYFILGAIWIHLHNGRFLPMISSLPVGLFIGLLFARHEHFAIDRKIEYVVLLGAALLSYLAPVGLVISI